MKLELQIRESTQITEEQVDAILVSLYYLEHKKGVSK